jgi:hypothetical protein
MVTRTSISNTELIFTSVVSGSNDFSETRATGKNHNRAIFGFGYTGASNVSFINLVNVFGGVATDTSTAGLARYYLAAAGYGGDKAIFGFGNSGSSASPALSRVISKFNNLGTYVSDTSAAVATSRYGLAAAGYGGDKAMFGWGNTGAAWMSYFNNVGDCTSESNGTSGTWGTSNRNGMAAATYGGDKAIFGYGNGGTAIYLFNNLGAYVSQVTIASTGSTSRGDLAAATYGGDKVIFGFGLISTIPLTYFSNVGVFVRETSGATQGGITYRYSLAAAGYGGDKAIFGYGQRTSYFSTSNLVSNTGVVSSDITGVGTARYGLAAASWG